MNISLITLMIIFKNITKLLLETTAWMRQVISSGGILHFHFFHCLSAVRQCWVHTCIFKRFNCVPQYQIEQTRTIFTASMLVFMTVKKFYIFQRTSHVIVLLRPNRIWMHFVIFRKNILFFTWKEEGNCFY